MSEATRYLKTLKHKYFFIRISEVVLVAIAVGLLTYSVASFVTTTTSIKFLASGLVFITTLLALYFKHKLNLLNEKRIISFVNANYPTLEESVDLLVKPNQQLTFLEQLQIKKIGQEFNQLYPKIKFPHHLERAMLILIACAALSSALLSFVSSSAPSSGIDPENNSNVVRSRVVTKLPAAITKASVTLSPPAYTGITAKSTQDLHLSILEGTTVSWNVEFTDEIQSAKLVFSGGDSLATELKSGNYLAQRKFQKSSFYQIAWKSNTGEWKSSDYFKIEITLDQAPKIKIHQLTQFTELKFTDKLSFDLKSSLSDDFGLREAYIIATVSKGSGESVKFREENLKFTTPVTIAGKSIQASRNIDLIKLGLEPGDELYFYVEALDNKAPLPNKNRTETFFVALKDTASQTMSVEGGLGVDLMPEYFRSQRQIIIDSEKLLRDRKKISKEEFNFKSNELGYDQKILRLKYGEFLGEEFESAIGPGAELPVEDGEHHEEESAEDLSKKFGHVHDKENEHNLVPDKKHHHATEDPEKPENIADAYKHVHDDPEEATFFTQSIRAKLKAALTVMWDAELHLRMFDPEKSLPYQYQALKLLKEISNDSRIYVHKTGFDPPPIKEDKRLTGDLSEIKNSKRQIDADDEVLYPNLKSALALLEKKLQNTNPIITQTEKQILLKAGNELSEFALREPGNYLEALSLIKSVNEDQIKPTELTISLTKIRRAIWKALPKEKVLPGHEKQVTHALDRSFIKNLEQLKND